MLKGLCRDTAEKIEKSSGPHHPLGVICPHDRYHTGAGAGRIGSLAAAQYSFMGFQGFPPDTTAWQEEYGPQVAARFKAENVDCVFLTPA